MAKCNKDIPHFQQIKRYGVQAQLTRRYVSLLDAVVRFGLRLVGVGPCGLPLALLVCRR